MYEELANLLFPNLPFTVEEIEAKYPARDLKEGAMVTRFGPSPTGFMHVGNLYGAFIGSELARQSDGVFYLRIEDTDSKREVEGATDLILSSLKHFKIYPTEGFSYGGSYGPYKQSERKDIYQAYAKKLISEGKAYPCFMSEEEISEIREGQELRKEAIGIYGVYAVDRDLSFDEVKDHLAKGDSYVIRMKSPGDMHNEIILDNNAKGSESMVFNTGAALLDAIVLAVVSREDEGTYGYKITQDVRKAIDVSESTLYPVLRRLQKGDYLEVYDRQFDGRNRRYYKVTESGRTQLAMYQKEWKEYSGKISELFEGGRLE